MKDTKAFTIVIISLAGCISVLVYGISEAQNPISWCESNYYNMNLEQCVRTNLVNHLVFLLSIGIGGSVFAVLGLPLILNSETQATIDYKRLNGESVRE